MAAPAFELVGPSRSVQLYGIRLLGVDAENGRKLLFTVLFVFFVYWLGKLMSWTAHRLLGRGGVRYSFWARQGTSLATFVVALLGFVSIWFDNPERIATGVGLMGAGLAFALQKVVSSFAGYFVILRGKTFNVGDRITMGGVRGDVISLNFMQTVIMEIGQPPAVQASDPGMWVQSRQFSGRIVTVSNSKIFDEPVYNYTRDFPFIWEEMHLPISYRDSRDTVERILLDAATRETVKIEELAQPALDLLEAKYFVRPIDMAPRVYVRLTDNWVEMTVRFLCRDHDIRGLKDRMSREVIANLDKAKIGIASGTYEIVGLPPIRVDVRGDRA